MVRGDEFPLFSHFGQGNGGDGLALQGDHAPKLTVGYQSGSISAHECGQVAVERGRRASPLQVAQHGLPCFKSCLIFDFLCDVFRRAFACAPVRVDTLGDDHDAVRFAPLEAVDDDVAQIAHLVGQFRQEHDVSSSGHAAVQCQPSRFVPHDFDDHHPLVRAGCGVEAVDGFGGHFDG